MREYKIIKANELGCNYIHHEDVTSVEFLAKSLKFKYKIATIFISIFLFVTSSISIPSIISVDFSINTFAFSIATIFLIYLFIHIIKLRKSVKNLVPSKAQYGTLKEKHMDIWKDEDGDKKCYYLDVAFDTNNTLLERAETARITYFNSKLGDNILVVSFDGKKAYAMKSKSI